MKPDSKVINAAHRFSKSTIVKWAEKQELLQTKRMREILQRQREHERNGRTLEQFFGLQEIEVWGDIHIGDKDENE